MIKNKQFASWPGITAKAVAKHYPESEETMKGHGRKGCSGLCSTKPMEPPPKPQYKDDKTQLASILKEYNIFIKIIAIEEEGNATIFLDQTKPFPKKSSQGNQYIMVLAHPNSNEILQQLMKNREPYLRQYDTRISSPHRPTKKRRHHPQFPHP